MKDENCTIKECLNYRDKRKYNCCLKFPVECGLRLLINNLTKDLAIHKKALEIASWKHIGCPEYYKNKLCKDTLNRKNEIKDTCVSCWYDYYLQQAREQEGK